MNRLTSIMDNGHSTQFLSVAAFRREPMTDFISDDRISIKGRNSGGNGGTVVLLDQESERFDLSSFFVLQSEFVAACFRLLDSTTITRIIDENPSRKIEILSPALTERRIMAQELLQYQELSADWDGDNGHAPALLDIENAVAFMDHIPDKGIASAKLMVAGDGDVGFYWRNDNFYLEIGFQDGNISFYGKPSEGEKIGGDERFDGVSVPEKLDYWMKFIFSD